MGGFCFGAEGGTLRSNLSPLARRAARLRAFAARPRKTPTLRRFLSRLRVPLKNGKTKNHRVGGFCFGAEGGTRTHTLSPTTDFESVTSANSITSAQLDYFSIRDFGLQDCPGEIPYISFNTATPRLNPFPRNGILNGNGYGILKRFVSVAARKRRAVHTVFWRLIEFGNE